MVINLDVLILENILVNYFLLYITSQTLKIKSNFKKYIIPSTIGGFYVITMIYPGLKVLTILPIKLSVALIMIILLFRKKDILFNLKALLIYILFSMLIAGICFYIEFSNISSIDFDYIKIDFSYKKLMLSIMIAYMFLHRLITFIRDRSEVNSLIFNVDIIYKSLEKNVVAFLDTGNELREPITNLPVMIIESDLCKSFNINEKELLYIPYKVVNGQSGKLLGFKPECIKIHRKNYIEEREVIIAFCSDKLSSLNDYNALLSRGII